jgi:catechol 2,3-dioxygenase-like lactoylglutathione lyase family enzyme
MQVERVDFVAVPTRDRERAVRFYGETLGLRRNELAHADFPEFETGNLTLATVTPEELGMPFSPLPPGQIAFRVDDVAHRARSSRPPVSSLGARRSTRASATWPSSATRTATAS